MIVLFGKRYAENKKDTSDSCGFVKVNKHSVKFMDAQKNLLFTMNKWGILCQYAPKTKTHHFFNFEHDGNGKGWEDSEKEYEALREKLTVKTEFVRFRGTTEKAYFYAR